MPAAWFIGKHLHSILMLAESALAAHAVQDIHLSRQKCVLTRTSLPSCSREANGQGASGGEERLNCRREGQGQYKERRRGAKLLEGGKWAAAEQGGRRGANLQEASKGAGTERRGKRG